MIKFIIFYIYIFYIYMKFVTSKDHFNYIDTGINSNIYFITFGGGYNKSHSRTSSDNYHRAVGRICKEAVSLNIFNKIYGITENYLLNGEYWEKHGKFTLNNHRGFGYWLWKPYIINKLFEKLKDGDILIYADSGCVLHKKDISVEKVNSFFKNTNTLSINTKYNNLFGDPYYGKSKWLIIHYIKQNNAKCSDVFTENEKILIPDIKEIISAEYGYKCKWINVTDKLLKHVNVTNKLLNVPYILYGVFNRFVCDKSYTKQDLLKYLNISDNLAKGRQVEGGRQVIIKNKETTEFLKSWYDICIKDNYRYINDTPSIIPNPKCFREHRHDQSIFSLLIKKYKYTNSKSIDIVHNYIYAPRKRTGDIDVEYFNWINS